MEDIRNKKYYKKDINKDWFYKNGFKYNPILSNDTDVYSVRFPVYKNGFFTILDCEISIYTDTGDVNIEVFEYGTRDRYASFYYAEYGDYSIMLKKIWEQINKELKKFGIKEKNTKEITKR